MKVITIDPLKTALKKVSFENLEFECLVLFKYLTIELNSDLKNCIVMISKNPLTLYEYNHGNEWHDDKAEEFDIIAYVDLSDETQERIKYLTENNHKI